MEPRTAVREASVNDFSAYHQGTKWLHFDGVVPVSTRQMLVAPRVCPFLGTACRDAYRCDWLATEVTSMCPRTSDEQAQFAADKREFVADWREDAADRRDAVADAREAEADAREAQLNRRMRTFDTAVQVGEPGARPSHNIEARAARDPAVEARQAAGTARRLEQTSRDAATRRRLTAGAHTVIAAAFAQIADQLYDAESYDEVLTRIAEAAVATVTGSDLASVTLRERGHYRTVGATAQQATDVDQEQYDADEGPCLDAFHTPLVEVATLPDERWPTLGSHPVEHGIESSVSFRLGSTRPGDPEPPIGSLNIYSTAPAAFTPCAIEMGSLLAAHASQAARAVRERSGLEHLGKQLQEALLFRDVIGQAKGILMERFKATPEDAFEMLKHSSQCLNIKLREVAQRLTETGEVNIRSNVERPGDFEPRSTT